MKGVKIGNKHTYDDFGLILSSKEISPPEPQTKLIEIPLRDGSLDITESLTGDVRYKDRKITLTFAFVDDINTWTSKISEIENFLHGKRMQVIFDDDVAFFYVGRLAVNKFTSNKSIGKLVIEGTVEPYKYDLQSTLDDWEWDSFDFEDGVINEVSNIEVNGTASVSLLARRKRTYPIITSDATMTVQFHGKVYSVKVGTNKIYEIILEEGENTLLFTGTGTVSIEYRGGSL